MTNPAAVSDLLVTDYLDDLERALADAPRARRRELVDEIAAHIDQARGELPDGGSEAEVRTLLERLGDPAEIAAGAGDHDPTLAAPPATRPRSWVEGLALLLLPIGGILLPVIGWFVGVALLWGSGRWTTRDKLVGTFVLPGGFLPFFAIMWLGSGTSSCSGLLDVTEDGGTGARTADPGSTVCTDDGSLSGVLLIPLVAILVLAPLFTLVYLSRRLRQRTA